MAINNEVKIGLGMLAATILIIAGGAYYSSRQSGVAFDESQTFERSQLVSANSPTAGDPNPRVTIVEFGDFQCPSCGAFFPIMQQLRQQYQNRPVQFVFRQFPLPQHEHALLAAQAALAAQAQGKFWEYHDLLFANQNNITPADLEKYASQLSLDVNAFKSSLDQETYLSAIEKDISAGQAVGVQGTPTIFINGQRYTGQFSTAQLNAIIDADLQ